LKRLSSSGASHSAIIEKIDIGGISLIRAAAKNYKDVTCISSKDDYKLFLNILKEKNGILSNSERKLFALKSFNISSNYDTAIFNYFNSENDVTALKISDNNAKILRYGENPHQKGFFYGDFDKVFDKIHGKELSYNNLLDVDAAVNLILEFKEEKPTFAILKHNNACGIATRDNIKQAYIDALAADPVSAFGGVLISNSEIGTDVAELINNLFCEVVIAPKFSEESLNILKQKKNRIILVLKEFNEPEFIIRSCLNGYLSQQKDKHTDSLIDFKFATETKPSDKQIEDLLFASKVCKNTKSNTIVLVKNKQLLASGTGQTSRVDALNQAIHKAVSFKFDLNGAAMASDAFFPFPDCVEIANKNGINSVIQPGGSIKDNLSVDYCNENKIPMVFTGFRHFKH
jgi:phosphoribosylaminoimidazolecarboxamide formyltransferase/IMP cyclohydrolase